MGKAMRAAQSAELLLEAGDVDGACNRAYYAMFDAARAALMAADVPARTQTTRTHGGLISAFGLHLVKPGKISSELGRILNRAQEFRLVADYTGDSLEEGDAVQIVEDAKRFVLAMQDRFNL
ncbi:MAG: HEPN domain-containing protein [Gammaproteobacteria bacterium]|nr:HEPN domain-containing protein [Gammaproteobacteria bacterium]NNJ84491.1 HEPN domain-containing protein [Gammaproteobacteria bacterium]